MNINISPSNNKNNIFLNIATPLGMSYKFTSYLMFFMLYGFLFIDIRPEIFKVSSEILPNIGGWKTWLFFSIMAGLVLTIRRRVSYIHSTLSDASTLTNMFLGFVSTLCCVFYIFVLYETFPNILFSNQLGVFCWLFLVSPFGLAIIILSVISIDASKIYIQRTI